MTNGRRIGGIEETASILSLLRLQDWRDSKICWGEQNDGLEMVERAK